MLEPSYIGPYTFEISSWSAVFNVRAIVSSIPVEIQAPPSFLEPSLLHGFLLPWNSHHNENLYRKNYNFTVYCHYVIVMVLFVFINFITAIELICLTALYLISLTLKQLLYYILLLSNYLIFQWYLLELCGAEMALSIANLPW